MEYWLFFNINFKFMVRFPQHLKQYLGTLILIAFLGGCTSIRVRVKDHAPGDQHREVVRLSKRSLKNQLTS